jgi:hypothetical protein
VFVLGAQRTVSVITAISSQNQIIGSGVLINGKMKSKAQVLADYGKYGKCASSTDHLRCVQDIKHHVQNKVVSSSSTATSFPLPEEDSQVLLLSDCIATLVSSGEKIWLCIGEINGLKFNGQSVTYLNLDMLSEGTVTVSYQVLGLRPATVDDDPDNRHDWRTY